MRSYSTETAFTRHKHAKYSLQKRSKAGGEIFERHMNFKQTRGEFEAAHVINKTAQVRYRGMALDSPSA